MKIELIMRLFNIRTRMLSGMFWTLVMSDNCRLTPCVERMNSQAHIHFAVDFIS